MVVAAAAAAVLAAGPPCWLGLAGLAGVCPYPTPAEGRRQLAAPGEGVGGRGGRGGAGRGSNDIGGERGGKREGERAGWQGR